MNAGDLARAGDDNLAVTWATLGRSNGSDVVEEEALTLMASGLPIAFFNGAFVHAPTDDPERLARTAIEFFAARNAPFLVWLRDGAYPDVESAGRALGLRAVGGPPAMALPEIDDGPAAPPELDMQFAASSDDVLDHASTLREGFGFPEHVADRLIRPEVLDASSLAIVVGRVEGEAVATALLSVSGTTAGVYNVATLPAFRGRRYGEAVTRAVVVEGARRGCTHAVLQASQAGHPVYRRMGFVDVGRYVQLEGPPPGS